MDFARVTVEDDVVDLPVADLAIKVVASVSVMVVESAASMTDAITRLSRVDCASCTAEVAVARFLTARRAPKAADCAVLTAVDDVAWWKAAIRLIVVPATA